ncbi:hypothetical protein [Streptomyces nodosus]
MATKIGIALAEAIVLRLVMELWTAYARRITVAGATVAPNAA